MTDATNIANTNVYDEFQDELKPGTQLLQGQYTIEKYLNSGGFAITYLARDSLDRQVVIKECFPGSFCRRSKAVVQARSRAHQNEYKAIVRLFIQEARGLAKLNHPNIVGVHQVFEDNETAYMALDLIKGRDLLDTLEDERKLLKPNDIAQILKKVLGAVKYMHDKNVLHRDISPDNILLNEDLEPILIDFGAAREQASKVGKVLSALRVVKDGYSPQEFYVSGSIQGPSSDLYALGASFYHLMTGVIPPDSQIRLAAAAAREPDPYKPLYGNLKGYDDIFLMAIDKSLQLMPKDRLQSADEWLAKIEQKEYAKASSNEDDVTATVAQLLQQPDLAAAKPSKPKPEPITAESEPTTAPAAKSKPGKNRLDEIANEMAHEVAQKKKKVVGKVLAGMTVAAALAGTTVYTQTDLLSGLLGSIDKLGGSAVSSSGADSQSADPTSQTVSSEIDANTSEIADTIVPVTPENSTVADPYVANVPDANTDGNDTAIATPTEGEAIPQSEQAPDTTIITEEPETFAPVEADQNISVAQTDEPTAATESPEVLTSFTPVDLAGSEIGLSEPKITDVTEISLHLPSFQSPKIADTKLALNTPLEQAAADAVSFELETTAITPTFSTDIGQSLLELGDGSGSSLTARDSAFVNPDIAQPVQEITKQASLDAMVPEDGPQVSTKPIELSSIIVPVTYLTTNWSALLPFKADESNGVTITQVNSDAELWMKEGQIIVELNGEPVETNADIERILANLTANSNAATVPVVFGVSDQTGAVAEHKTDLKLIGKTSLEDGTTFETVFESGKWKTTVTAVEEEAVEEFSVGDILIANVEAKEKIEGRNAFADILNMGFSSGKDSLRFIVDRDGSNWFATVHVSEVGGFRKTTLNHTKTGD